MAFLDLSFLDNTVRAWIMALLTALAIQLGLWITKRILLARFVALSKKTKNQADDLIVSILSSTKFTLMGLLALYAGSLMLTFPESVKFWIGRITLFTVLVQVAVWTR